MDRLHRESKKIKKSIHKVLNRGSTLKVAINSLNVKKIELKKYLKTLYPSFEFYKETDLYRISQEVYKSEKKFKKLDRAKKIFKKKITKNLPKVC